MSKPWPWRRVDFGNVGGVPAHRATAEVETNNDLQKPIQQLICDVREEAQSDHLSEQKKLIHMTTHMVSMMGRVALIQERAERRLLLLTWGIFVLTVVLVVLTVKILIAH